MLLYVLLRRLVVKAGRLDTLTNLCSSLRTAVHGLGMMLNSAIAICPTMVRCLPAIYYSP